MSRCVVQGAVAIGFLCLVPVLALAGWYAPELLQCERERYYEGETIRCTLRLDRVKNPAATDAVIAWSTLGKTWKREEFTLTHPYKVLPRVSLEAPKGLRAVTPLTLIFNLMEPYHAELASHSFQDFEIFPRDPRYWVGEDEFKGKTILVDPSADWVRSELDALRIPYLVDSGGDLLHLKRIDLTINAKTLDGIDRQDPWSRWVLVQTIRKALAGQQAAKETDSTPSKK